MKRITLIGGTAALLLLSALALLTNGSRAGTTYKVILIGVDGGSWDIIRRLAAQNKIPNLQKLMQQGASGYLDSISWKKRSDRIQGLYSPIIWSTIATGKLPSKHGIEDFKLPIPGSTKLRMGYREGEEPAPTRLRFPFNARDPMVLILTARLPPGRDSITIHAFLNERPIGSAKLSNTFQPYRFQIPSETVLWDGNVITFRWDQYQKDRLAADVESIRIYNSAGHELLDYEHSRNPDYFLNGWIHNVQQQLSLASSYHFRTRTLWEILSGMNRRIGVVGWWATWPAYKINGYLVSSHVGLQGERLFPRKGSNFLDVLPDLTYPKNLIEELKPLYLPKDRMIPEFEKRFFQLGICGCIGINQEKIVLRRFWQDQFFADISRHILRDKEELDLFAVYLRGTDTMAHQFIGWTEDRALLESECAAHSGCDLQRLHQSLENYYNFIDARIGEILKYSDRKTFTFVITDHGEFAKGRKGVHKNNGFMIAAGPGIKRTNLQKASVLDITPTILHLLGLPVAQDMDGRVLLEAMERKLMLERPVAYIDSYDRLIRGGSQQVITDRNLEEQDTEELKALGYIN
jgi:hypothetical protein